MLSALVIPCSCMFYRLVFCSTDGFSYLKKGDKVVEFVRCHVNSINDADSW